MYLLDAAASSFNLTNFVATIGATVVSILLIIFNTISTKKTIKSTEKNTANAIKASLESTTATLNSKRIEERKSEIYKALNDLYGPLYQLRQKSNLLYLKFQQRKIANADDGRFSTLLYLLDNGGPGSLADNDKVLLDEIIKIGGLCESLIYNKAGLIDNEELRTKWFPAASKHFLIIGLAYKGSLKKDLDLYKDSMFPKEIDDLIEKQIKKLQDELSLLK